MGAVCTGRRRQCIRVVLLRLGVAPSKPTHRAGFGPEVEWGSVFYFTGKRRRVAIDETRSVGWKNPRRLRLETHSLGPVTINVMEIAKEERQKLYDAIARRISGP